MRRLAIGVTGLVALAGCAEDMGRTDAVTTAGTGSVATVSADIRNAVGQSKARAIATQLGDSLRVRVEAMGMPMGSYGAHIHTTGRCDAPAFTSAGAHWNPTARMHGKNNGAGQHHGDLPNLAVGTDGRGSFEITLPMTSISGGGGSALLDADGAAIVIHAQPDDYRTDPSGNSGTRIACGVFG